MQQCDTCGHHANLIGGMCEECHSRYGDYDLMPVGPLVQAERRLERDEIAAGMAVANTGFP